jgi:hypothetical protein
MGNTVHFGKTVWKKTIVALERRVLPCFSVESQIARSFISSPGTHQVVHSIVSGRVPDPEVRIGNCRVLIAEDVLNLAAEPEQRGGVQKLDADKLIDAAMETFKGGGSQSGKRCCG